MRNVFKCVLLLSCFLIGGCDEPNSSSKSSNIVSISSTTVKEHSYDEVKDKMILYSNIFGFDEDDYYVYFFSRTCSHCNSLKPFIIEQALAKNNIYFVESSDAVVFVENVESTIGLMSIENFGILGYPTLIEIKDKTIVKNLVGIPLIKNELTN